MCSLKAKDKVIFYLLRSSSSIYLKAKETYEKNIKLTLVKY